ncbi:Holliday junction branch migration protein RuvA [bacterium]|nr:Holliday junction branch migration protein RuvA [bacterium]
MYAYIKGTLTEIHATHAVIDVGGVGYHLFIPISLYTKMPPLQKELLLYTSFVVREDSQRLFGFETKGDKALFEKLIAISGLGPKTALAIIGQNDQIPLEEVIGRKDAAALTKIPGIGKKTAERIIIELDGKLTPSSKKSPISSSTSDAILALVSLGYKEKEAMKQVESAQKQDPTATIEKLITMSLMQK